MKNITPPFPRLLAQYTDISPLNGSSNRGSVRCPFHDDRTPSLSITGDLFHCFGCGAKGRGIEQFRALIRKHRLQPRPNGHPGQGGGGVSQPPSRSLKTVTRTGLTLAELAAAKKLPKTFLRQLGVRNAPYYSPHAVSITYRDFEGNEQAVRYRLALDGPERFRWRPKAKPPFYGLDRWREIRNAGWVLLVEGESDCWTAWHHGIPALGIPGKESWPACWSRCPVEIRDLLRKVRVFLWQEPDAISLPKIVGENLPDLRILRPRYKGIKDLGDVHLRVGDQTARVVEKLMCKALTLDIWRQRTETAGEKARRHESAAKARAYAEQARTVLTHPDPLTLVGRELQRQRYGGSLRLPLLAYLAETSRVLALDKAAMPVHVLLLGPSGGGKTFLLKIIRGQVPSDCWHEVTAGSPRALIYDTEDIRHKVIVFAEADSLPSSEREDNPVASAIRTLLQDGEMRYDVTEKDPVTGSFTVRHIRRPGPAVLITTSTRKLPPQMDTRVFTLEVPDDARQIKASLRAQATTELEGRPEPDAALVAFQGYLQVKAPWRVVVPFALALQRELARSPALSPRTNRDLSRLLSLIKSVTVLRHRHRERDERGRLRATVKDYRTVYRLLKPFYEATATGASAETRKAVQVVKALRADSPGTPVTATAVARRLQLSLPSASLRIKRAVDAGWLVNEGHGRRFDLKIGEPMPSSSGLPTPSALVRGSKRLKRSEGGGETPPLPPSSRTHHPRRRAGGTR